MKCSDIRAWFRAELSAGRYATDRKGSRTIELHGASFIADESSIFGKPDPAYIQAETEWYKSMSLNVRDLGKMLAIARGYTQSEAEHRHAEVPKQWKETANSWGNVHSNYGYLALSEANGNQIERVVDELVRNPWSRRAVMIYTRPTMHNEYNARGMNDFICTNAVSYTIRDGQLITVVQMRSNDVVYGYKNDWAWQELMRDTVVSYYNDLTSGDKIVKGPLHWQVQNLHVYERHFYLVSQDAR